MRLLREQHSRQHLDARIKELELSGPQNEYSFRFRIKEVIESLYSDFRDYIEYDEESERHIFENEPVMREKFVELVEEELKKL
jgi:hypothetical protein